jgi:hypothetical protein
VKTTEPFELFSKGTTPAVAARDCTALNTSAMLGEGARVWVLAGKELRAAWGGMLERVFVYAWVEMGDEGGMYRSRDSLFTLLPPHRKYLPDVCSSPLGPERQRLVSRLQTFSMFTLRWGLEVWWRCKD